MRCMKITYGLNTGINGEINIKQSTCINNSDSDSNVVLDNSDDNKKVF